MEEKGSSKQLLIKIKIPKLEGVVEEHDGDLEEGEIREEEADIGSKDLKTSLINPNPNKNNIRVCPECNKEFSSGKALGGHMRIHSQQKQSNPHKKKLKPVQTARFKKTQNNKFMDKSQQQQQPPDYLSKCTDEYGRTFCTLCGKNFPTIKSLCGHMRCHPERYWRGISPPDHDQSSIVVHNNNNNCKNSSPSLLLSTDDLSLISYGDGSVDDDMVIDLPKWTVRAKRSRRVERSPEIGKTEEEEEEEEEVQLLDAVEDLMRLANGPQSFNESGLTHKQQRVDEFEATNGNSLTNKDDSGLKKRKFDREMEGEAVIQMSENDDKYKNLSGNELSASNEPKSFSSSGISTTPNKMRRKKMKLMMDLESGLDVSPRTPPRPAASQAHQKPSHVVGATTPDKYKCSTCNKSFLTHQALGGHRSSHNKIRITILNAVVDINEDHYEDNGTKEGNVKLDKTAKDSVVASSGSTTSTHQCTICNKVFPTGQALGGHKRCHWTGPAADPPSSHSSGEANQTAGEGSKRVVLEFDLNDVPPMEDEGGDNGNGHSVSSSYNSNIG